MIEYKSLKVDISKGVALITIARPAAMNALNSEFFTGFNEILG